MKKMTDNIEKAKMIVDEFNESDFVFKLNGLALFHPDESVKTIALGLYKDLIQTLFTTAVYTFAHESQLIVGDINLSLPVRIKNTDETIYFIKKYNPDTNECSLVNLFDDDFLPVSTVDISDLVNVVTEQKLSILKKINSN